MTAAYLNTRVSLFADRRWLPSEYDALLSAPENLLASLLDGKGLAELAQGFGGGDPRSLEARLVSQVLDETLILLRALRDDARQFILYWTERFEVSNVKTLIRAKMAGERPASIHPRLLSMGPFSRLDMDALLQVEDASELLRRLENSPYAEIVRHAREAFEESHDPFVLDATLDRAYYEGLVRRSRSLERALGKPMHDLMASLVDRTNLVWLLRYRFNYGLPPAQVYYLLVAAGYRLNSSLLKQLVAMPNVEAVLAGLPPVLARQIGDGRSIPDVTWDLEAAAMVQVARVVASDAPPLVRAFAYLLLRERDLRAVRAVLRGRQLRLPMAVIRQALGEAA
jgi:V/A-type H+-transporting ATPase subunit C